MEYQFKTILHPVENIVLKEKGSRFIGYAFPVRSAEEVKEYLEKIKSEHPKATHHCYAFRLGPKGEHYRANDDGEPSGSAGLPIYNQLLAYDLTQILLIAVRYYGGTKLGVSGLVKAYKETAKYTLAGASVVVKELETWMNIEFPFSQQNAIFTLLNRFDATIMDFVSDEKCRIKASVKRSQIKSISEYLSGMPLIVFENSD